MFPLWVKLRVAITSFSCHEDEVYQLLECCVLEAPCNTLEHLGACSRVEAKQQFQLTAFHA